MCVPELLFRERVWLIVSAIPAGKVATYGDIARMAGSPRAARQVGALLSKLPCDSLLPWYRVINARGNIVLTGPDLDRQKKLLEAEGVKVSECGKISLPYFRWAG